MQFLYFVYLSNQVIRKKVFFWNLKYWGGKKAYIAKDSTHSINNSHKRRNHLCIGEKYHHYIFKLKCKESPSSSSIIWLKCYRVIWREWDIYVYLKYSRTLLYIDLSLRQLQYSLFLSITIIATNWKCFLISNELYRFEILL